MSSKSKACSSVIGLKVMTGLFQNGCHEKFILVTQFQQLHFTLDYGIKGTYCALIVLAPFRNWNSFNNARKDGKFGIDLVHFMLNTLQTLELANVSQLFTAT